MPVPALASHPLKAVRFKGGATDAVPIPFSTTWGDLFKDVISADRDGAIALRSNHSKLSTPAWSPVEYAPGATRSKAGVVAAYALVLDFDGGSHDAIKKLCEEKGLDCDTPEKLKAARAALPRAVLEELGFNSIQRLLQILREGKEGELFNLAFLLHTSWSHNSDTKPIAMRIVVPLSRPVPRAEWEAFWGRSDQWFEGLCDEACSDASRIYFGAARPVDLSAEDSKHLFKQYEGNLLDVDFVLSLPEPPKKAAAKTAKARLVSSAASLSKEGRAAIVQAARSAAPGPGDRYKLRLALAGTFRNFGLDQSTAEELVFACDTGGEGGLGDEENCNDKVSTTYAKNEGEAFMAEGSLREIVGNQVADVITAALRQAATHAARVALDVVASQGTKTAYFSEGSIRSLTDLYVTDRLEYEMRMEQMRAESKGASTIQKLVQAELKKRKAAAKTNDEFDRGADDLPKPSLLNTMVALEKMGCFRTNLLRHEVHDSRTDSFLRDEDMTELAAEIHKSHGFECVRYIHDAVAAVAMRKAYDPIREYLRKLPAWDGTDRITATVRQFTNDLLAPLFVKKTLIACCARGLNPPQKVDTVLVLQGEQGMGKSTFFKVLGGDFYSDTSIDLRDKDAKASASRIWVSEWSEMIQARGADRERLKGFVSSEIDVFRPSYGRHLIESPRRTVFVGTLNPGAFLDDPTGSRRFWVIEVEKRIDVKELVRDCDQIWAQALAAYDAGEQWYLTPDEDRARGEQNSAYEKENLWEYKIQLISPNLPKAFSLAELCLNHLLLDPDNARKNQGAIAAALRALGFDDGRKYKPSPGEKKSRKRLWWGGDRSGVTLLGAPEREPMTH